MLNGGLWLAGAPCTWLAWRQYGSAAVAMGSSIHDFGGNPCNDSATVASCSVLCASCLLACFRVLFGRLLHLQGEVR